MSSCGSSRLVANRQGMENKKFDHVVNEVCLISILSRFYPIIQSMLECHVERAGESCTSRSSNIYDRQAVICLETSNLKDKIRPGYPDPWSIPSSHRGESSQQLAASAEYQNMAPTRNPVRSYNHLSLLYSPRFADLLAVMNVRIAVLCNSPVCNINIMTRFIMHARLS